MGAIISGLRIDVPSSYLDIEHTFCQRHCVAANSALGHIRQSREEAVNGTPVEGYVYMAPRTDDVRTNDGFTPLARGISNPRDLNINRATAVSNQ